MVDHYLKYNIVSKCDTPDMLSVHTVNRNEVDEYERYDFDDSDYTMYYFWYNNKIHAAKETYSRVALLYDSVLNEIGYLKARENQADSGTSLEWYNGYECHLESHRYLFFEIPVCSYMRYNIPANSSRYTCISCFEILDTYACFEEFAKVFTRRIRTFSKLIKVKTIEFYYELNVTFNKEQVFGIKDSDAEYIVENLENYKELSHEWCELLRE